MMKARKMTKSALMMTAAVMAVFPMAASAQDASAQADAQAGQDDPKVIIVTARRAGENIQDIPVSITAFSSEALTRASAQGLLDIQTSTPSLFAVASNTSPAGLQINMRGQVVTGTAASDAGAVGVYFDDVFQGASGLAGGLFNFEDIERVEVLKGPQGTLYGRNVTGGVVRFVTNKPSDEFEGYIKGTVGNYDLYGVSGMLNIPFGDIGAFRVVANYRDRGGYSFDTLSQREIESAEQFSGRAQLLLNVSDRVTVLATGYIGEFDGDGTDTRMTYLQPGFSPAGAAVAIQQGLATAAQLAPFVFFGPRVGPCLVPNPTACTLTPAQIGAFGAAAALYGRIEPQVQGAVQNLRNAPRSRAAQNPTYPQSNTANLAGGDLTVSVELSDDITLKSITAYVEGERGGRFNVGGGPFAVITTNQFGKNEQWTQEIQLNGTTLDGALQFALGGFYLNSTITDDRQTSSEDGFTPFFLGARGLQVQGGNDAFNTNKVKSIAFYGQATYDITDTISFTGGLRYTDETSTVTSIGFGLDPRVVGGTAANYVTCLGPAPENSSTTTVANCRPGRDSSNFTNWSYTAGLDWDITDDILVYAKTSRGFKSGGTNVFSAAYTPLTAFGPETNTDYEVGIKAEFWDGRARANLTYYHTDYDGIQKTISFQVAQGLIATGTQNAASAKIDGVEFDASITPVDGLTLSGTFAYTNPRYLDYRVPNAAFPGGFRDQSAQEFQYNAKYTYSLGANYEFSVGDDLDVNALVNWSHRSSASLFEQDLTPSTPGGPSAPIASTQQPAYGLLDASLSVDIKPIDTTITVWGRNVLNKRYFNSIISLVNNGVGAGFGTFGAPATFGVDVTKRF
jgi:iron complex outermembrane receptor protein